MAYVDIRPVKRKDGMYFFQECSPGGFDSVRVSYFKYVVALYPLVFDGTDTMDMTNVYALCIDDELFSFCTDRYGGDFTRTFNGGVHGRFDMLVEQMFFARVCE